MKYLEKDRQRRYDSASTLADDVRRHLECEPVAARPPSAWYRAKKFMQRHGKLLGVSVALAVTLVVGLVVSTTLYVRMRRAAHAVVRLESQIDVDARLSTVRGLYAQGRRGAALQELERLGVEQDLGPRARLLQGQLLIELKCAREAETILQPLTQADPATAGAAYYLLAQLNVGTDEVRAREHETRAAALLPDTAEAYLLRAMTALEATEALQWLDRAIECDPSHYAARRARALFHYCRVDNRAEEDVAVLIALRPEDALGYTLRAVLRRESGDLVEALADHNRALELAESPAERAEIHDQRYRTYLCMGDYASGLEEARCLVGSYPQDIEYRLRIVMCLLVLEDYEGARREYRSLVQTSPSRDRYLRYALSWYVIDSLRKGQQMGGIPPEIERQAPFAAIRGMIDCYTELMRIATPVSTERQGLIPFAWSPDGRQLLCGWGGTGGALREAIRHTVPSVNRGASLKILDIDSGAERHLSSSLGGPAVWSPDGKYIAFPDGDCNLQLVPAAGGPSRTLVHGDATFYYPQWSGDSRTLYFREQGRGPGLCRIDIDGTDPIPTGFRECFGRFVVNETEGWIAREQPTGVTVADLPSGSRRYHLASPWPVNGWRLSVSQRPRVVLCNLAILRQHRPHHPRHDRQATVPGSGSPGGPIALVT